MSRMEPPPQPPDSDEAISHQMLGHDPDDRDGPSDPIGAHTFNWRTLTDEESPIEWERLRAWVAWFVTRYDVPISTIPECWYKHPALVEELSALHIAHDASFDKTDSGLGPIGWQERLSLAHPRLTRAYAGGCTRGHTTPRHRTLTTDTDDWTAWTTQAHAHPDTPVSTNGRNTT